MVLSRLRFAAGVCVLAAGLLMGGGAVAVADPGSSGSAAHGDDGTNASVQGGNGRQPSRQGYWHCRRRRSGQRARRHAPPRPRDKRADAAWRHGQRRLAWLGPRNQASSLPPARKARRRPGGTGRATDTEDQKEDAGLVAAVPDPVAAVPNEVAPVSNVVAPVTDVVAPVTDVVAPVTNRGGAGY